MEYNIIYYCIEKANYAEGDPDMDPHLRRILLQHLHRFLETKVRTVYFIYIFDYWMELID